MSDRKYRAHGRKVSQPLPKTKQLPVSSKLPSTGRNNQCPTGLLTPGKVTTWSELISRRENKKLKADLVAPFVDVKDFKVPFGMLRNSSDFKLHSSDLSEATDFLNPSLTYKILLKGFATITSSAGAVVASFIPFDPSSTGFNFGEWSNVASLFTEFRLISFHCQFVASNIGNIGGGPVAIGSNLGLSAAPTSVGQVINQADGIFWRGFNETTALGYTHSVKPATKIGWSLTSTPTNTPYAGAPGCIMAYGTSQGATNTIALVRVMGLYEFRVRN